MLHFKHEFIMIPLFTSEQIRAADNYAIKELQIPGEILMENAALNIVNAIFEKYPYLDNSYRFGIVCGKGNNGGDGFVVARQLLIRGFNVHVVSLGNEKDLKGDALTNYKILKNFIEEYPNSSFKYFNSISDLNKVLQCEIIVDALLGTGSIGELRTPYNRIVEKLNQSESLKIAIDIPTGLDLDNASGKIIFNANLTVTLAGMKTGLFYEEGRVNSGKVIVGSIGIGEKYFDNLNTNDFLIEPEDALKFLPQKPVNIHKYSSGKVLTIAGSSSMSGAAIFCMNAAMISGTGAGYLAFPKSNKEIPQTQLNSAIVIDYNDNGRGFLTQNNIIEIEEKINWADTIAIGSGLGRNVEIEEAIFEILKKYSNKNFVIDADAIAAIGRKGYKKLNLENSVLTPHHAEFACLLGIDLAKLKKDLLKYGKEFCFETGAYLVLKGAPTIIFNPEGESFINTTGNSGLAKFGSGDVLTGMIASFLSQQKDIEQSIISAVYLHSLSADLIKKRESEFGIVLQKIIDQIPQTIKFLRKSVIV